MNNNRTRIYTILERLVALSVTSFVSALCLYGQGASDFSFTVTSKSATCPLNGQITFHVTKRTGTPSYDYKAHYALLNRDGFSVLSTEFVSNSTLNNIAPGEYIAKARIENLSTGTFFDLPDQSVSITSSYKVPTLKINVVRKSLRNYRTNEATGPLGTGIVSVLVSDGTPPFQLTIVESSDPNRLNETFPLTQGVESRIYDLKPGTYKIKVSQACGDLPLQTIRMEAVASDLPSVGALGFQTYASASEDMRQGRCGWMRLYKEASTNPELYPYSSMDTLAKYYEYAWQTDEAKRQGVPRSYHSFGEVPPFGSAGHGSDQYALYYKLPDNKTAKDLAKEPDRSRYWPHLFLKVKGSTEEVSVEPYNYYTPPFVSYYKRFVGQCDETYIIKFTPQTWLLWCFPLEVKVSNLADLSDTQTIYLDSYNSKELERPLQSDALYRVEVKEKNGDVRSFDIPRYIYKYAEIHESVSNVYNYCSNVISRKKEAYLRALDKNLANSTIRFVSAPEGFLPREGALSVGESVTLPSTYHGIVYLFSPKTSLDRKSAIDLDFPLGDYVFEILDPCKRRFILTWKNTESVLPSGGLYTADASVFRPKVVSEECGRVRIYPFANDYTGLLKKDGVSINPSFYVAKLPEGIRWTDVRTNLTNSLQNNTPFTVSSAGSGVRPEEIYLDFPQTNATLKMRLVQGVDLPQIHEFYNKKCMPVLEIPLSNAPLSYDKDTYTAYRCPSGTSGQIRITPINNLGRVTVKLYEKGAVEPFFTREHIEGGEVLIPLIGTPEKNISEEYRIVILDEECQNTADEIIPIYLISSPSVIRFKEQQRKYCLGQRIELDVAVHFQGFSYEWILPDGTRRQGRTLVIEDAQSSHNGQYILVIKSVLCDNVYTSQQIPFFISVAPEELWWRKEARDADWHNLDNWALSDGTPYRAVPSACTKVHIPAVVDVAYPDLSGVTTARSYFGVPECQDIYFHYGAQLGAPTELRYLKAFIDYNFGIMSSGQITAHRPERHPQADSHLLARDRWYMLSAPLLNMAFGDFCLAGYPKTYSCSLSSNRLQSLTEASFDQTSNSLGSIGNAFALKVAGWSADKLGYNNHKFLNALSGVIRVPFFEDDTRLAAYPLHSFDKNSRTSSFRYYYEKTLEPVAKIQRVSRGRGVSPYRFAYEEYNAEYPRQSSIGTISLSGTSVFGYSLSRYNRTEGEYFMVGNPFMTPIDFDKLLGANVGTIYPYYYLFVDGAWRIYSLETGAISTMRKEIAPLQAVVLRSKVAAEQTVSLLFPTSGEQNVLLPSWRLSLNEDPIRVQSGNASTHTIDSSPVSSLLALRLISRQGACSEAFLGWSSTGESAPALVYPGTESSLSISILDPDSKVAQSIAYLQRSVPVLDLALFASLPGEMSLSFDNIDRSLYQSLVLEDKLTQQRQDLLTNPVYHFLYNPSSMQPSRFRLHLQRWGVVNEQKDETSFELSVKKESTSLFISATLPLESVALYGINGELLYQGRCQGKRHSVELQSSWLHQTFLLEAYSVQGDRVVSKIGF